MKLTAEQKLKAVETYLQSDIKSESDSLEVLNKIWYVVMEDTIL